MSIPLLVVDGIVKLKRLVVDVVSAHAITVEVLGKRLVGDFLARGVLDNNFLTDIVERHLKLDVFIEWGVPKRLLDLHSNLFEVKTIRPPKVVGVTCNERSFPMIRWSLLRPHRKRAAIRSVCLVCE